MPEGFSFNGTLETGYIIEGKPNIMLRKNFSTGLYHVDGTVILQLKAKNVCKASFDKGTINYVDPSGIEGNVAINTTVTEVLDNVVPEINYAGAVSNPNQNNIKVIAFLNGTHTEIQEVRYIHSSTKDSTMTVGKFKELKNLSKDITAHVTKNANYLDIQIEYAKYNNQANYSFVEIDIKNKGYYYIYTKDLHGNEALVEWKFENIGNSIPNIT